MESPELHDSAESVHLRTVSTSTRYDTKLCSFIVDFGNLRPPIHLKYTVKRGAPGVGIVGESACPLHQIGETCIPARNDILAGKFNLTRDSHGLLHLIVGLGSDIDLVKRLEYKISEIGRASCRERG